MSFVTAPDGAQIAIHSLGGPNTEPALFIPGGPCRGVEYIGDLAGLGTARALTVIHPRGTAHTGGLSRGWWNDADDVIAVADATGVESIDLVAHSAGTRLALATAARYPSRVRSMLLVTPPAAWLAGVPHDGPEVAAQSTDPALTAALASMAGPGPATEREFQRSLGVEAPAGYAKWTDVEREHSKVGAMSLAASTAWFKDIPDDAANSILSIALPRALVIGGRQDLLTGLRPVQAYVEALHAEAIFIDDCGHYPWLEQPDAFYRGAADWLCQ
jgi:pimeloyl-ACP methyl ester carboxylesterase